jgi:hypothetical protein
MQIEATILMEDNDGIEREMLIIAEYEPTEPADRDEYGRPTEFDSDEICDIISIDGIDPDKMFLRFNIAYSNKQYWNKLEGAVREQFDREFYAYSC